LRLVRSMLPAFCTDLRRGVDNVVICPACLKKNNGGGGGGAIKSLVLVCYVCSDLYVCVCSNLYVSSILSSMP
jgi:hypothetical protein